MSTIKSSREIDRLFTQGRRTSHPLLLLITDRTPDGRGPEGRVVVIAGKKLGGAVMRNRSKRVLREAIRRADGPWPGWDVALIARTGTATASAEELDRALIAALKRAGILE